MKIDTVVTGDIHHIHVPLHLSHGWNRTTTVIPKPKPVRKPGWKRDTERSLLKVVLVSNAQSIKSDYL